MKPAPIEIIDWKRGMPKPSFEQIRDMTLACLGLKLDQSENALRHNKTMPYILARQLIYRVAGRVRNMSSVEVVEELNLSTHSVLVGRGATSAMKTMETNAGAAMVNEIIYSLMQGMKENPPDFVHYPIDKPVAPGEYREAARRALRKQAR